MAPSHDRTFSGDFRKFFFRGLGILLPSVLTLWILVQAYFFVDRSVAEPINAGVRRVVLWSAPQVWSDDHLPQWFAVRQEQITRFKADREAQAQRPLSDVEIRNTIRARNMREWWDSHWYLRGVGLFVAIVLIYLAGRVLGGYIGRRIYHRLEGLMTRIPVFKQVYPHVKQVTDFLMGSSEKRLKFNRVVLVEYPRKDIWTVGLLTGNSMRDIEGVAGEECVTVFIPSSPTPFTGYTITVFRKETIDLPISIDEALRFVISGGVLVPDSQELHRPEAGSEADRRASDSATALAIGASEAEKRSDKGRGNGR